MTCLQQAKDMFSNMRSPNPLLTEKTSVFKSRRVKADFLRIPIKRQQSDRARKLAEFMVQTRTRLSWWPDNLKAKGLQLHVPPPSKHSYTEADPNVQLHQGSFCSSIIKINQKVQLAILSVLAETNMHAHFRYAKLYTNNKLVFQPFCYNNFMSEEFLHKNQ